MTTTISLFWIILFVFIMHTALTYVFAHMMHSNDDDKNTAGFILAVLEWIGIMITIAALTS